MTTVHWDPSERILYADSRSTGDVHCGNRTYTRYKDSATKVVLFPPDTAPIFDDMPALAMAGAGDVKTIEFLTQMLIMYGFNVHIQIDRIPNFRQLLKPTTKARVLVFTAKRVYRFSFRKGRLLEYSQPIESGKPLTIGSGAEHLHAFARVFELSTELLLRYTRLVDHATGGTIFRYQFTDDGAFVPLDDIPPTDFATEHNTLQRAIADLPAHEVRNQNVVYFGDHPAYQAAVKYRMENP